MAALTLEVRSATSLLYLASSRSSSVWFALTMAMLSFMRGTWSFMSRMFCSRISSGFSATEMKKPKNERIARLNRLHIGVLSSTTFLRLSVGIRHRADGDWVGRHEVCDRVGDLL